jgi:predicted transcriptional regulator
MSGATVRIRPDLKAKLDDLAAQTHRDQSELANEALAAYLEREQRNSATIHAGLAQARRGGFATDEEVKACFARHGKPGA